MDMNEMLSQLANNPQMAAQLNQLLQQNGGIPVMNPQKNWNMATNPMAQMWMANMAAMMNAQNTYPQQQNQNNQQPQQPQQTTDNVVAAVRVVKNPSEIRMDEIPMNGSISLFLQDDKSVIYGKQWTNNGVLENIRFVREYEDVQNVQETSTNSVNNVSIDVEALMTNISSLIDGKLEEFRNVYFVDKKQNSPKTATVKKGEENGK